MLMWPSLLILFLNTVLKFKLATFLKMFSMSIFNRKCMIDLPILLSLTHVQWGSMIEKYCFEVKISKWSFLMNLHVLRKLESESYIFSSWLVGLCLPIINITSKLIIGQTPNFIFYIYFCRYDQKFFYEDQRNSFHTRVRKTVRKLYVPWTEFLVIAF